MTYQFEPGKMYRMPTHFGPSSGPRQGPDGRRFENKDNPKITIMAVSYLTNPDQLEALLPPKFELAGEPVVTVAALYMTEIEWLAGRGYNILAVFFPASFRGEQDHVTGDFMPVLWESLADPIITGREELGNPKIYCELPEPTVLGGERHAIAHWQGFKFCDLKVNNLNQLSDDEVDALNAQNNYGQGSGVNEGIFNYKYIPSTGDWGAADVGEASLSPGENADGVIKERWSGEGTVEFHKARWEDMPTQYNIVNTLYDLEIREYRGASVTKKVGAKDYRDQRILR